MQPMENTWGVRWVSNGKHASVTAEGGVCWGGVFLGGCISVMQRLCTARLLLCRFVGMSADGPGSVQKGDKVEVLFEEGSFEHWYMGTVIEVKAKGPHKWQWDNDPKEVHDLRAKQYGITHCNDVPSLPFAQEARFHPEP